MKELSITEKQVSSANFQFVFPFSLIRGKEDDLVEKLKKNQFKWFRLDNLEKEDDFYGRFEIDHENMENFFLPFTNRILFPKKEDGKGFQRYSKMYLVSGTLQTKYCSTKFVVESIDITVCPYQLGFLTIRIHLEDQDQSLNLTEAIHFASEFRIMEQNQPTSKIIYEDQEFEHVERFLLDCLMPEIKKYMDDSTEDNAYFESFPFFENNHLYVQSLIGLVPDEKIEDYDVYRLGNLDGYSQNKNPYISCNNQQFIDQYMESIVYTRWAPFTYYIPDEQGIACITNRTNEAFNNIASTFYGEYYYGLMLTLFHKITLLKVANEYSRVRISQDTKQVEKLIHAINAFSSNYYFFELATNSKGRDIFIRLRERFKVDDLFEDTRATLQSLNQYQENFTSKQGNMLLQILTLYSVITGIFGMNLVSEQLKGNINWSSLLSSYNRLEYLALFVTLTGVFISIILGLRFIFLWIIDKRDRKKWRKEIEYPNTK
ncbi:hypothetical protein [Bacillus sp. D386]|uniref:hypothetical protein n=1 Tax=Bacillus sp. D386 TaxID=2587155 RepID=UPI001121DB16|nr:hypothetical protein [Bacillus sp. D386]